jgi:hypothetical protein
MKKLLTLAIVLALSLVLTGCPSAFTREGGPDLGTHAINIDKDAAVTINSRTVRGAPDVEVTREDGTRVVIRNSDIKDQIQAILDALK